MSKLNQPLQKKRLNQATKHPVGIFVIYIVYSVHSFVISFHSLFVVFIVGGVVNFASWVGERGLQKANKSSYYPLVG